jgi:pimeloyl-ACP methyl ester carboxylesterase
MSENDQLHVSDRTTGHVISRDGTRIGYRRLGQGPGLVLLHGSMESAKSHRQLAEALADLFTVYLPDRRGRGLSGPYGPDHGIRQEVEDLDALLTQTGTHNVFGVSASGLVALEAARTLPAVHKIAVYEPALLMDGSTLTAWLPRYDKEMARGKVAAAMVTSMKGLKLGPPILGVMPTWLLASLTNLALKSEDKKAAADDVTMRELAPTLHHEGRLLAEMAGTLDGFGTVGAEVLLLGGSKGLPYLKPSLDALERVLPHARRVEFPGLDHGGSSDVSPANSGGKPEVVAPELRRFFTEP